MKRIFRFFCINWFGIGSLQILSSRSDFGFDFAMIFVIENRLPVINDTGSRRLHVSVIRGVAHFPHQRYRESLTPRIDDMGSRILTLKKNLSVLVMCRVVDSPHRWYGEPTTPRISDTGSWRLRVSVIWGVDDSSYRWVGELPSDSPVLHLDVFPLQGPELCTLQSPVLHLDVYPLEVPDLYLDVSTLRSPVLHLDVST